MSPSRNPEWYVGKASVKRCPSDPKRHVPGALKRFQEHVYNTIRLPDAVKRYRRYKSWHQDLPADLRFVPIFWGRENEVLTLEANLIRFLPAPTQQKAFLCRDIRVDQFRAWPRFRAKPSIAREIGLNVNVYLKKCAETGATSSAMQIKSATPAAMAAP